MKSYRELIVWQKSLKVSRLVYSLTKKLPKEEIYSLVPQMRRAAASIISNIAEGHERRSTKEYVQFLSIANGSKAELEAQLLMCVEVGNLTEEDITETMDLLKEVEKMLGAITNALEK
ncbi:MAG: four helix bundle protein [Elusimicrobiota bacterium]|nr:four helix bundle protein [Elusimicrobiota bacterium]